MAYRCTKCGRDVGRDGLKSKVITFREMGAAGTLLKSKTVDWLCSVPHPDGTPSCLDQDEVWNMPSRRGTPQDRAQQKEVKLTPEDVIKAANELIRQHQEEQIKTGDDPDSGPIGDIIRAANSLNDQYGKANDSDGTKS